MYTYSCIYKVIYATTPTPISGLLSLRSNESNLRGKMKPILPRANTSKYGLHTFRYSGAKMWNSLQDELGTAPTIKHFVYQIRINNVRRTLVVVFYAVHRFKFNLLAFDSYKYVFYNLISCLSYN